MSEPPTPLHGTPSSSFVHVPHAASVRHDSPPPSRPIPTDFRSSLATWWNSNGYRDARTAEDRLLRRLNYYQPSAQEVPKGWFSWGHAEADERPVTTVTPSQNGLVASIRKVFIPTPDPHAAPAYPGAPVASSVESIHSQDSGKCKKDHRLSIHHKHHDGKMVDYINTLEFSSPEIKDSKEAVVVLHGYAAALGFFFRNWESIANSGAATGRRTFFLDWLGMGLSSRPSPSLISSPPTAPVEQRVSRAEHFFLSSLESWRAAEGIEKMVLVGHSLGGYLASAYALQYPNRVSSLILVSPAGIPHGELSQGSMKTAGKNSKASLEQQPHEHQDESFDKAADAAEMEMHNPKTTSPEEAQKANEASAMRRGLTKFFLWGWEKGMSPFSILRGIGPWGPLLVGKYSSRRFAAQTPEDVRDLHSYIYSTSILKGSGEFCICKLFPLSQS